MPLIHSKSKKAVGPNIEREEEAGKPHDQAVAIALHTQDDAKKRPHLEKFKARHGMKEKRK